MDNKLPKALDDGKEVAIPTTDLSDKDLAQVQDYQDRGLPNIVNVTDEMIGRMMALYLSGKSYTDIGRTMRVERGMVVFLSKKFDWFPARRDHLSELAANIESRITESDIRSQDFLLQLIHAWEKKIGKKIQKYLSSDDDSHTNEINLKEVDKYLNVVAALEKKRSGSKPKKSAVPAVGLNLGDGVTIEQTGQNKVTITPTKERATGNLLREFADFRREEEKRKQETVSELKEKRKTGESNES